MVQCLRIVRNKQLDKLLLKNWQRKVLLDYKYFTRWSKRYKLSKDELYDEHTLAATIRKYWGYGEFKVCFFDSYMKNKWGRRDKYGKLRKRTMGFAPRCHYLIKEGYNIDTDEDYLYEFYPEDNKMHLMPFWKGKVKRKLKSKDENVISEKPLLEGYVVEI